MNNYEISFWNLQGLTSHGVVIKCVDNGKKNRKKGEEPLNIGVVKPKISDIGSRLSRKFSSKNEVKFAYEIDKINEDKAVIFDNYVVSFTR